MFRNSGDVSVLSGLRLLKWSICLRVTFFWSQRYWSLYSEVTGKWLYSVAVSVSVCWVNVSMVESQYATLFRDKIPVGQFFLVILRMFRYVYETFVKTQLRTILVPKLSSGFSSNYKIKYFTVCSGATLLESGDLFGMGRPFCSGGDPCGVEPSFSIQVTNHFAVLRPFWNKATLMGRGRTHLSVMERVVVVIPIWSGGTPLVWGDAIGRRGDPS